MTALAHNPRSTLFAFYILSISSKCVCIDCCVLVTPWFRTYPVVGGMRVILLSLPVVVGVHLSNKITYGHWGFLVIKPSSRKTEWAFFLFFLLGWYFYTLLYAIFLNMCYFYCRVLVGFLPDLLVVYRPRFSQEYSPSLFSPFFPSRQKPLHSQHQLRAE